MASLQARHVKDCPLAPWTTFKDAQDGCRCPRGPTYFIYDRTGGGSRKVNAGRNRRVAERTLARIEAEIIEGRFRPLKTMTFAAWAEDWLTRVQVKESTKGLYARSVRSAATIFGQKLVSSIEPEDIVEFIARRRRAGASDSTIWQDTATIRTCLESARRFGYAAGNAVDDLPRGERPRKSTREAGYFTNDELRRLFASFHDSRQLVVFTLASETGMRQGELIALRWSDIDFPKTEIRVRASFSNGFLSTPKNGKPRTVDLTPAAMRALAAWWKETLPASLDGLVFVGQAADGYLRHNSVPGVALCGNEACGDPSGGCERCHAKLSLVPAYLRQARDGARFAAHLASAPAWAFNHPGHERHLRTLGVQGTESADPTVGRAGRGGRTRWAPLS
jgi:integrase